MRKEYNIYWGDTHHNTFTFVRSPSFDSMVEFASKHLDFYTAAYYTPTHTWARSIDQATGKPFPNEKYALALEIDKSPKKIKEEWAEIETVTAKYNKDGFFVTFPGYEWQGNGYWGDFNVVYKSEGEAVYITSNIKKLYDILRAIGTKAIAIPHHTAYYPGIRAPFWKVCDEKISPFAEIYSVHGCSETDEEYPGMRGNSHMGPGTAGGTYSSALQSGLHLGAICSTDNWTNTPGRWNHGLMACLAKELTRESIWEAFENRRVYGVTGDRIQINYTLNNTPMGSIIEYTPKRNIHIEVSGSDALDRIEILKNERVLDTYCHQGKWNKPKKGDISKYKIRLEMGWGPRITDLPETKHTWNGSISLSQGKLITWEPSWINPYQKPPIIEGNKAFFEMLSEQKYVTEHYQGGILFEFESVPEAHIELEINNQKFTTTVKEMMSSSHILWYKKETLDMIEKHTGLKVDELPRQNPLIYHYSYKVKIHKVIPWEGYSATFSIIDTDPGEIETYYRIRIEQRNAQKAWSSPIWIKRKKDFL